MTQPTVTFELLSPGSIAFNSLPAFPGFIYGDPSLFDLDFTASTFPAAYTLGWHDGWCVDRTTAITVPGIYTASIYSSYEYDNLRANPHFSTLGNDSLNPIDALVPRDLSHPAQPFLQNLDIVNWLLNNIQVNTNTYNDTINGTHYNNIPYYSVTGIAGNYTYGDLEQSMYQLLGDGQSSNVFLGSFDMNRVHAIVAQAVTHDGYVPGAGEKLDVILDLGQGLQPIIVQTIAAELGDRVWNDTNADGIQNVDGGGNYTEAGISGATVNLFRDLNNNHHNDGGLEQLATTTTNASGYYDFKGLTPGLDYQVEFIKPVGYDSVSPRQVDANAASGTNSDAPVSNVVVLAPGEFNKTIDAGFYQTQGHVAIDKVTVDNPAAGDGLTILTGEPISWLYKVTNTGNVGLSNVVVSDNEPGVTPTYVSGDNGDNVLQVGETWIYSAPGTSIPGPYSNIGTVHGDYTDGNGQSHTVSANDASNYLGVTPQIAIDKVTVDGAASGDGINILSGEAISWKYTVTNTGNVALTNVTVVDDNGTAATADDITVGTIASLAAGDSTVLTLSGTSTTGSYSNSATASGTITDDAGHTRSATATDTSSYYGETPSIAIDKVTVDDTASGDGINILSGEAISWNYTVTNTGNVALTNVTVVDDNGTVSTADDVTVGTIASLAAGASTVLTLNGTSTTGSYSNSATASGTITDDAGHTRSASATDTSSYYGETPSIAIDKVTVDDTASGDGINILSGEAISWNYTVTNTGNVALTNVTVVDDNGTATTADDITVGTIASLAAGASTVLTLNGTSGTGSYSNSATASGTITDDAGHTRSATATDTSSYYGEAPALAIDKVTVDGAASGDGINILSGEAISWKYTVTNTGNVALTNVTVVDDNGTVSTADDITVGTIASLAAGDSTVLTLSGTSTTGSYSNSATASGTITDDAGHTRSATATDTSSYYGEAPALAIDKVTVDGAASGDGINILSGEAISWKYTVTNTGNVALTNVTVVDDNGTVSTADDITVGTIASLAAGDSTVLTLSGTSTTGSYSNSATASGTITDDAGHTRSATATDTSSYYGEAPALAIDKVTVDGAASGDGINILSGEAISWKYTVTNTGNVALTNVTVVDDNGTVSTADDITVGTIASLAAGDSTVLTLNGTSTTGSYSNSATASGTITDDAGHTRSATATDTSSYYGEAPALAIDKVTVDGAVSGDGINILSGEAISWNYTVTNTGNVALTNVTVVDDNGTVSTADDVTVGTIASLAAGASTVLTLNGTSTTGSYNNSATASGTITDDAGHTRSASATDTSSYFGETPALAINKVTVDGAASGDGINILSGEAISWKYTVTNTGNVALTNVKVVDDNGTATTADDITVGTIASLAAGASTVLTLNGTSGTGSYSNSATATGSITDTAGHTRSATATDTSSYFGETPALAIDKVTVDGAVSGDGINILSGEAISWKYTVTNTGNVALTNVTVVDDNGTASTADDITVGTIASLAAGASTVLTMSGTSGSGSYANSATATGSITDTAGHTRTATATDTSSYFGETPQIAVDKVTVYGATSGDGLTIPVGAAISWKYTVTNTGNVALSNVTLTDTPQGAVTAHTGDTNSNGLLDTNETWVYTLNGTATAGSYSNLATATGNIADTAGHTRTTTASDGSSYFGTTPTGDLSVTKTDGLTTVSPGQAITYTIVASNTGTANAVNALVSDTMPAYLTNVSWTSVASAGASGNDLSGTGNINDFVNLNAGSSITYTVHATVANAAALQTLADFGAGTNNTNLGQNITINGVKADAFYLSSGVYKTTNTVLWERDLPSDHGIGVWSNGEPDPIANGGDVNEISNQLNNDVIRLTKAAGQQWTSLWVSSLDSGGSGNAETGTFYWSNSATADLSTLTSKFTFKYGDFGANVEEGDVLTLHPTGFDANAQYVYFVAGPNAAGTNNDYLFWKATTAATALTNTVTITAPGGFTDTNPGNNSASDTDTIALKASLGDRLWADSNVNGQQDDGATGISGQTITLIGGGADGKISTTADNTTTTTTTGTDGFYQFTNLTAGVEYQVQFSKPADSPSLKYVYTTPNIGSDTTDSDAIVATGKSQIVTLSPGENNMTVDAGVYKVSVDIQKYVSGDTCTIVNNCGGEGASVDYWKGNCTWQSSLGSYGWSGTGCKSTDSFNSVFGVNCSGGTQTLYQVLCSTGTSSQQVMMRECVAAYLNSCSNGVDYAYSKDEVCAETKYACSTGNYSSVCNSFSYENNQGCSFTTPKTTWNCTVDAKLYDADVAPGLDLKVGSTVTFTYIVHNTGDTALKNVVVTDDRIATVTYVSGDTNNNGLLDLNEAWTYKAQETVAAGTIKNTGTVTALDAVGSVAQVTAHDDAFYTGFTTSTTKCASIGDRVWEDKNFNGIQDAGESGIAGVTVTLKMAGADGVFGTADDSTATTTTNASGNYQFNNLAAGNYQVVVTSPTGYFDTKQNVGSNDAVDSDVNSSGTTGVIALAAGEQNLTIDAGLYRKASVGDKVWDDMNHNYVQDASEPGIANIKVALMDSTGTTILATTTTDANGNYLFSNLDPGNYVLQFDKTNVMHYNYGAWYNMSTWKWAPKDVGTNDAIDSDVAGNGVATTNVTKTDVFTLASGQNDMTRDAGITPIVIDLDGNGVQTVSRADSGGSFDLFGNGKGVASGWISGTDGFLAVDSNGNGKIDSIDELFGGTAKGAGFAKLATFDTNGDGVVNAKDAGYAKLSVWVDANGNHQTDAGELHSLAEAGVTSLSVANTELPFMDANGNLHLERGNATLSGGQAVETTDVYFNVSAADAAAAGVALPTMADLMPGSADYGVSVALQSGLVNDAGISFAGVTAASGTMDVGAANVAATDVQPTFAGIACDAITVDQPVDLVTVVGSQVEPAHQWAIAA